MKTITSIVRYAFFACVLVCCTLGQSHAQEKNVVKLTLHARSVSENPDDVRLLPREHELRDGNAAIELLRMPWEQTHFIKLKDKHMSDWLEMKGNDPELMKWDSAFTPFKEKMRRAAYTRDADWDYPLGEQPMVTILLPDVQGMREYTGRIMSLWIKIQIAKGNLKDAEEGLLIQMACARHVSRTPFAVCQLVGAAIAKMGFTQLEDLIQHPKSDNFYFALSTQPNTLGNFKSATELESTMIRSAMPVLDRDSLPPIGDTKWKIAFNELFEYYIASITSIDKLDQNDLKRKLKTAAEELPSLTGFSADQIEKMSDEEKAIRWLLIHTEQLGANYIAATQQPTHQAIQSLAKLETEADELNAKVAFKSTVEVPEGAIQSRFFDIFSIRGFLGCHRTGRHAKLLQIVEAIRDHASKNENRMPGSLSEIELSLPLDPFTNQPADYELEDGVATLSWPLIPNLGEELNYRRVYKLKMADTK